MGHAFPIVAVFHKLYFLRKIKNSLTLKVPVTHKYKMLLDNIE